MIHTLDGAKIRAVLARSSTEKDLAILTLQTDAAIKVEPRIEQDVSDIQPGDQVIAYGLVGDNVAHALGTISDPSAMTMIA